MALVGDERLFGEGSKLSGAQIANDERRGVPDFSVNEIDGGRDELFYAGAFSHHAGLVVRLDGTGSHVRRIRVPFEPTGDGPLKVPGNPILQGARAVPGALIVGIVNLAVRIEADPAR